MGNRKELCSQNNALISIKLSSNKPPPLQVANCKGGGLLLLYLIIFISRLCGGSPALHRGFRASDQGTKVQTISEKYKFFAYFCFLGHKNMHKCALVCADLYVCDKIISQIILNNHGIVVNLHHKTRNMIIFFSPGSRCWAAFLKMGARHENGPTILL